jgi:hypothetical protein
MELLPIIETALLVFTVFTVVALSVSYSLYKIKKNEQKAEAVQIQQEPAPQYLQQAAIVQQTPYQEQMYQLQQRQIQRQEAERVQNLRPRERFQVVNNQQSDLRVAAAITPANQPFYHPRSVENRHQRASRKSFNLFDNYSNGGEKLEKLNLSVNV